MKRSKMIEEVYFFLDNQEGDFSTKESGCFFAERILALIEVNGMAPPEISEPVKTAIIVATPFGYQEQVTEDSKVFVRRWEDET